MFTFVDPTDGVTSPERSHTEHPDLRDAWFSRAFSPGLVVERTRVRHVHSGGGGVAAVQ